MFAAKEMAEKRAHAIANKLTLSHKCQSQYTQWIPELSVCTMYVRDVHTNTHRIAEFSIVTIAPSEIIHES